MTNEREKTISASGEVIPKPYGVSRWANPRVRLCAHGCGNEAKSLRRDESLEKAHNCCGEHE